MPRSPSLDPHAPPNFNGNYPLAGGQIGPAWRAAWRPLAEAAARTGGEWLPATHLVPAMCAAGGVAPKTATNLLAAARRAGLLDVAYEGPRRSALYRAHRRG